MLRLLVALALVASGCSTTAPAAPEAGRLLILNKDAASAWLVDLASGERVATMPTGVGPHEAVVLPDGQTAVVTDYGQGTGGNTLTVLDLASGERTRTIDLGTLTRPHGIVSLGGTRVLVTSETQRVIATVDVASGAVLGTAATDGDGSHMVAATPEASGVAYTANIGSGTVSKIDLARGETVAQAEIGPVAEAIAIAPDGSEVWAASQTTGAVVALDAETLAERARTTVSGRPIRLTLTPDGARVLVTSVASGALTVLDAQTLGVVDTVDLGLGSTPVGTVVSADGSRAWVSLLTQNEVAEVDLSTFGIVRRFSADRTPDGLALAP